MRKTKISKRWLSLIMALLMVVTSVPLVAMPIITEAAVSWTPIASSDFSSVNSVSQDTAFTPSTYNGMGNTMTWTPHAWTGNGDPYVDGANGAVAIPDGYMYLSGYSGGSVPITGNGSKGWKLDFGFRFNTDDSDNDNYENSDNYCFLKMFVFDGDLTNPARKNAAYCYFCQNANGVGYSWEDDGHNVGTQSLGTSITTNNGNLVKDTNYHYIAEYTVNRFRTYITDDAGTIVQLIIDTTESTFLSRLGNISTTTVGSIKIGDDDNNYYFKGLEYRNITFYSGTSVDDASTAAHPNNANDKYVMAYFTGNYNLDNESLRYAVSSDGINFHTLNKGMPVTEINIPETGEGLTVYPTGASMTGAWSTGHVRDPYILRKQDGSGFYILATDLDTGTNGFNLNSKLLVWEVEKLEDVTNTQPWAIDVCSLIGSYTRRAWAPEAFYDAAKGKYFLHFSIKADGVYDNGTFLYGIYTSDFQSFDGTPKRLINTGADNIDASINYNSADNLYYMWYKNESNSKLNYATSVNADGPYVNQASFDYSLGVEGPEVFRNLANDGWIFLCDAFGEAADPATSKQGVFQAFTSSSISGFDTNSPVSTNIPYLYARHAGVARITNDEYNALISAYGPIADNNTADEFYFTGNTSASGGGWLGSVKDPSEHVFKIHRGDSGSYSAAAGVLTLNGANAFMQDDTVRTKLKGNEFTVSFKATITDSSNLNSSIPIAAIGNINKDYIRVNTNSSLYVNGATVDFSDDLTFEANTEYDIKISYNGATASLFVDGEFITSAVMDEKVVDPSGAQCYLALGWSDTCGTGRISATYKDLVITATSEDTRNTDDAAMSTYISNNLPTTADVSTLPTFTATAYHITDTATDGYNNLVYSAYNSAAWGGTTATETDNFKDYSGAKYKAVMPSSSVMVFDGIPGHEPYSPIMLETRGSNSNIQYNYAYIPKSTDKNNNYSNYNDNDNFAFNDNWTGYADTDYTKWAKNQTGYEAKDSIQGSYSADNSLTRSRTQNNPNTSRFWWNRLYYTGTGDTSNYWEVLTNMAINVSHKYEDWGTKNAHTTIYVSNSKVYVINYEPIYDILNGTTKVTVDGTQYTIEGLRNLIAANPNAYTPASVAQAVHAMNLVVASDPNNYNYSSGVETAVKNCASTIKSAVDEYNAINLVRQYKVTYNDYNNNEIEHYYFTEGTSANTVTELAPELPENFINDEYHYYYDWDNLFTAVTADVIYTQTETKTPHNYSYYGSNGDGTHTATCTEFGCTHTDTQACDFETVTYTTGDHHPYEIDECSVCGYKDLSTKKYIYTVTFVDEDGSTVLDQQSLLEGSTPVYAGETPTKAATAQYTYTFAGWDNDIAAVTGDATYTAQFTNNLRQYVILFKNYDGATLQDTPFYYGTTPVYSGALPVKAADAQYTYTFNTWSPTIADVTGEATYTATYSNTVNNYTITFVDEDGTTKLDEQTLPYGSTPVYAGETPTKAATAQYTYTFAGWDNDIATVTGDATYTATYSSTVNNYTITFVDEDGTTKLDEQTLPYGATPVYAGETPTKAATAQYTYTFNGWDNDIAAVTGDATYTATYSSTVNNYTITFVDEDGTTKLDEQTLPYGSTPVYAGETPTKAATAQYTYTFAGWDNDIAAVTGDATYTATYSSTVNKYAITFADVNDGTIKTENLDYGTTAEGVAAVAPTEFTGEVEHDATNHYTYGWDADFAEVTGPATYTREVKSTTAHNFGTYVTDNNGHHVANCTVSGCDITDTVNCTYENVYHAASGVNNGYTVPTCTVCGYEDMANAVYDETDWTAYTACLGVVEANLANTVKYSAASLTAYKNATDAIKATVTVGDQTKTQAFIDSKTAALTEAASLLELHSYTITFVKNVDGIETSSDIVANYGELVNLNYNGEGKVYKWTNNFTGVERTINVNTADYGVVVNGNATYTVYAATAAAEPAADTSKVSVIGKDRAVADMAYLENGTYDVSINGNAITIGDATLTAPVLFFYNVTGFTVNGEAIGESITINGDVDIKAVYTAKPAASMTITYTGCKNAETNVSGGPIDSAWDELITVTADGATKDTEWLINDKVVGYGETFTFRMTQTAVVTCRNGEEKAVAAINYMAYDSTRMVSKIVASYDLPEGATYISGGIINKNDTTAGATVENNKVTYEYLMASVGTSAQKVARTQTSDSQQFVFDISRKTDISFVTGAIAFVTYELGGEEYTVYSTEVSYMAYTKA